MRLIFIFLMLCGYAQANEMGQANKNYENEKYSEAIALYEKILTDKNPTGRVHYNLGNSFYKSEVFDKAVEHYQKALLFSDVNRISVQYNLGNALYRHGILKEDDNLDEAIADLEQSLVQYNRIEEKQRDEDFNHNIDFVEKELERLKNKKNFSTQSNQEQQNQNNQQDKQNKEQQNQQQNNQGSEGEQDSKKQGENQQDQQDQQNQQEKQNQQQKDDKSSDVPDQENKQEQQDNDSSESDKEKEQQSSPQKNNNQSNDQDKKENDVQADNQNSGQPPSGGDGRAQVQDPKELSKQEALMILQDYENNQQPDEMLRFMPIKQGAYAPVDKDW